MNNEIEWNDIAVTRQDWHNVAYILETFSVYGGEDILKKFLTSGREPDGKELEHEAARVFSKLNHRKAW